MAAIQPRSMPVRGDRTAPKFDDQPRSLARYFEDVSDLLALANITVEEEKIRYAQRYLNPDQYELWGTVTVPDNPTFEQYKEGIVKLYPGSDGASKYLETDLDAIAAAGLSAGTDTRSGEAEFYRKFLPVARYLMTEGLVSKSQVHQKYLSGFDAKSADAIRRRVEIVNSTVDPAKGYSLEQLHGAAQQCLSAVSYGGGGNTQGGGTGAGAGGGGGSSGVKQEPMTEEALSRAFVAALGALQQTHGSGGGRGGGYATGNYSGGGYGAGNYGGGTYTSANYNSGGYGGGTV